MRLMNLSYIDKLVVLFTSDVWLLTLRLKINAYKNVNRIILYYSFPYSKQHDDEGEGHRRHKHKKSKRSKEDKDVPEDMLGRGEEHKD